jgi:hypothetical protein
VTGWCSDGRALSEDELANIAQHDGELLCDYAGVAFRFSAETVAPARARRALPGETTTVMTLRRLDAHGWAPTVCLVAFARPSRLGDGGGDARFAEAAATTSRAARRHVAAELFRRAEETVSGDRVA